MPGLTPSAAAGTIEVHHSRQGAIRQFLLAVIAMAVAGGTSFAQQPKYLPDGCDFILTVNFAEVYDSQFYQKLKTGIADFAAGEKAFQEEIGLAPSNLARVTVAGSLKLPASGPGPGPLVTVQTRKPVSATDLRASRKPRKYQKDFSVNEIKVGEQSIYEATYHESWDEGKGELKHGESFAVLPDSVILFGANGDVLRMVLARSKSADLSPQLQNAIKAADFSKTLAYVLDLKALAADETLTTVFKQEFGALFGEAASSEFLKKSQSLSLEGSLQGPDAVVQGVLTASDAQTASDVKKIVEAVQVMLPGMLQKLPRVPKEVVDAINSVSFKVDGAKVNAHGAVKVDTVARWIEDEYAFQKKQEQQRAKAARPGRQPGSAAR